jgi:hypothetical protein
MSNIRGLYDDVKDDEENEEEKRRRDANNRYVGGVGAQGGGRYVTAKHVLLFTSITVALRTVKL